MYKTKEVAVMAWIKAPVFFSNLSNFKMYPLWITLVFSMESGTLDLGETSVTSRVKVFQSGVLGEKVLPSYNN